MKQSNEDRKKVAFRPEWNLSRLSLFVVVCNNERHDLEREREGSHHGDGDIVVFMPNKWSVLTHPHTISLALSRLQQPNELTN